MLVLFGLRDYRWLWISTLASFIAFNMEMVARAWLVLRLREDSPLALGFVMVSFAMPIVFVSLIGGALADRVPRKQMLVVSQTINALSDARNSYARHYQHRKILAPYRDGPHQRLNGSLQYA